MNRRSLLKREGTFLSPLACSFSLPWLLMCFLLGPNQMGFAVSSPTIATVSEEAFYFSPYNTYSDGVGRLLANNIHEKSNYALWVNPGSYFKTMFTGTSAVLNTDVTGSSNGQSPKVCWSIDGHPFITLQLHAGSNAIQLAKKLEPGTHSIFFLLSASDANLNRWREPVAGLKIYGISLDPGGTLRPPALSIALRPKKIIFFGDSITEGAWVLGNSDRRISGRYIDWVRYADALLAWPRAVATALDAEYGTCAFGGTGWVKAATPFVPALPESWQFYFDGHSRLTDGQLFPNPDYVIVNMGTNDGDRPTSAAIESWLKQIRHAVGQNVPIIIIIPFGQMNRNMITAALSKVRDRHIHKIDLGPQWAYGLSHYGYSSFTSFDGLHPNADATAGYAAAVVAAIVRAMMH